MYSMLKKYETCEKSPELVTTKLARNHNWQISLPRILDNDFCFRKSDFTLRGKSLMPRKQNQLQGNVKAPMKHVSVTVGLCRSVDACHVKNRCVALWEIVLCTFTKLFKTSMPISIDRLKTAGLMHSLVLRYSSFELWKGLVCSLHEVHPNSKSTQICSSVGRCTMLAL